MIEWAACWNTPHEQGHREEHMQCRGDRNDREEDGEHGTGQGSVPGGRPPESRDSDRNRHDSGPTVYLAADWIQSAINLRAPGSNVSSIRSYSCINPVFAFWNM